MNVKISVEVKIAEIVAKIVLCIWIHFRQGYPQAISSNPDKQTQLQNLLHHYHSEITQLQLLEIHCTSVQGNFGGSTTPQEMKKKDTADYTVNWKIFL